MVIRRELHVIQRLLLISISNVVCGKVVGSHGEHSYDHNAEIKKRHGMDQKSPKNPRTLRMRNKNHSKENLDNCTSKIEFNVRKEKEETFDNMVAP